ncbi:lipopolysaccharide biosynthesis protein [Phormidium sp. CCY1219]|uniref:lipopolysaccharide biosynthesis protein n=1 Tax=Phormidium sp. CCY1219 TaxID=2886104 RepID=UPI002D1E64E0|nr:lipopolysaccharide biosynthesis protein [Phormidium sp. CCY1219]MEB3830751.1 lipopolysaccharide biosynthesis protein [Phormidium sp. CCY1219]
MNYIATVQQKVKKKLNNKFVQNIGWLTGAEMAIRVIRLLTTVVLARFLTKYDYGLAAIVLTTYEFTFVFTDIGIGAKLVQADEDELEDLCKNAYWLSWVLYSGLFLGQCLASFPIAWFYGDRNLILPICVMGMVLLITPKAVVQAILLRRENRLEIRAINNTAVQGSSNLMSLALAYFLGPLGFGVWAIVIPKVLVAPLWVYIYLRNHSWRPSGGFRKDKWGEIFNFGKNVLGVELLKTLRTNLDYLLVGRFLGIKELGIYFFAFNAGLGISLSIIKSIKAALLPHLCNMRENLSQMKGQYYKSLKAIAALIIPLAVLQSSLAPFYVPIVFGEKWIEAIPVLMLICLSAIPRPFGQAASQLMIAIGRPDIDFRWNVIFTFMFTLSIFFGVQWQAIGVAIAVLIIHAIALPAYTFWASRYAFNKKG